MRELLRSINDSVVARYVQMINEGKFEYFKELEADPRRKAQEYYIRLKYWNYFRQQHLFFEKMKIYFKY
jgi:hypothetical protein